MAYIIENKSLKLTAQKKHSSKKIFSELLCQKTLNQKILKNLLPILLFVSRVLRTFLNAKDIAPIQSNCSILRPRPLLPRYAALDSAHGRVGAPTYISKFELK